MLNTLIESGAIRSRRPLASALSVAVHAALVTAAVLATRQISDAVSTPTQEDVRWTVTTPAPEPPAAGIPMPRRGFQLVIAPVHIPDQLPPIDLTQAITNADLFTGVGVPGGTPDGVVGAPGPGDAFTADQVERVARLVDGTGTPQYPETLRSAHLEGDVVLEFVIDTTGRADMRTIHVVASTHQRFTDSALHALTKARFVPAELGGQRVRQRVRMPLAFKLK